MPGRRFVHALPTAGCCRPNAHCGAVGTPQGTSVSGRGGRRDRRGEAEPTDDGQCVVVSAGQGRGGRAADVWQGCGAAGRDGGGDRNADRAADLLLALISPEARPASVALTPVAEAIASLRKAEQQAGQGQHGAVTEERQRQLRCRRSGPAMAGRSGHRVDQQRQAGADS